MRLAGFPNRPSHVQVRRSIAITLLSSNFNLVVMFAVTLVAARYLGPQDIGVFSIAVVCINLLAVFRDFGTDAYVLQAKRLDRAKVAAVLGATLSFSWVLAAGAYVARHDVATWFDSPGVAEVLEVILCSFLLVPFASLMSCLLQRDLRAADSARATLAGTACFAITCITLAMAGAGPLALAWANLANLLGTVAVLAMVRPANMAWRPSWSGWAEPLRFGAATAWGNLARVAHQGLPDLALGRLQGAHEVGLFSRANGLVGLIQQLLGPTLNAVSLPLLAREHHAQADLGAHLARACAYLTVLCWPALIWVALFPAEIIRVLYGPRWVEASELVALLALAAAMRVGYQLVQPGLVAVGRPHLSSWLLLAGLALRAGLLVARRPTDLHSFVLALVIADLLVVPLQAWLASRWLGFSLRAAALAHGQSLLVALGCGAAGGLLKAWLPADTAAHWVLLASAVAIVGAWLLGLRMVKHPFLYELGLLLAGLRRR
jgi:O-antigen/teichoic acid export membrane protein